MFTLLNSASLWIGTDLKRFNEIRDTLDAAHIPHKYKTKNQLGEWAGFEQGTVRGRMGSLGNSSDQMYEYEIIIYKNDLEQAKQLIAAHA